VHKVDKINVKRFVSEVFANHLEDRAFQNERIINGHKTDTLNAEPAGMATSSDTRIHDIICNEEEGLELERDI
jgi:hypothetical protein